MSGHPSLDDILGAVAGFLRDEALPALSGHTAFNARVAANAVELVRRELALGPARGAASAARLATLGLPDDRALAAAIRSGRVATDDPQLLDHLWKSAIDTVAIDQPSYGTYRQAVGAGAAAAKD